MLRIEALEERAVPANFTPGDIAVVDIASFTTAPKNSTGSILELSPSTPNQAAPVQTIAIDPTGANALRFSGTSTSSFLSLTNDGTLLAFSAYNTTDSTTPDLANSTATDRAVATLDPSANFAIQTTYTGTSGNQTRSATSLDDTNWFITDKGGLYTNNATTPSLSTNILNTRSFGGTVYVSSTKAAAGVSTLSSPTAATLDGLPGIPADSKIEDFYLIQSGANGSTYDILYTLDQNSTNATINKFSLVSGTWVANGTPYTLDANGGGMIAENNGSGGASLFVTTTAGTSDNSLVQLTDTAGYNADLNIATANNVTLFTATGDDYLKGLDFVPTVPPPPPPAPAIITLSSGVLTYTAAPGFDNNISVTVSSGNFVFTDSGETIDASSVPGSAGSISNSVTVPTTGVTAIDLELGDGDDTISSTGGVVLTTQKLTVDHDGTGLTVAGPLKTTSGSMTVNNTGTGDITVADSGLISATTGALLVSSNNGITVGGPISTTTGTLTLKANQDGVGTDSILQVPGINTNTIKTTNTTANAATIVVNTASGGTGSASLDLVIVGTSSGGTLNVNVNGGSMLYAGDDTNEPLDSTQQGLEHGGAAPVAPSTTTKLVIEAHDYILNATGAGSIGTADRPIQSFALASTTTMNITSGDGGAYDVDWDNPLVLTGATATGPGGILVVTANTSGHNLTVSGPVTTGSGNIYLAADDNFVLTAPIGGAGFSGTVYLAGNRDQGNTVNLDMNAGASITTSNNTANAVLLEGFSDNGTAAGSIILNSITVGDGGTITATTIPTSLTDSNGAITALNSSVVLNAGPTGTVDLIARPYPGTANAIGTLTNPIQVVAGNVNATAIASAATNGGVFISAAGDTLFTANVTAAAAGDSGNINLATTSGTLTIAGPTSTTNGGTITLSGADGVVIRPTTPPPFGPPPPPQLGSNDGGAISITGALSGGGGGPLGGGGGTIGDIIQLGTGGLTINEPADSTFDGVISGSQGVVKSGIGNLTFTKNQIFTGPAEVSGGTLTLGGSLTGPGGVTVDSGATLTNTTGSVSGPVIDSGNITPGGAGVGTLSIGDAVNNDGALSFGAGGALTLNLNGSTTPGTDYDQVNVTGTVDLTNSTLDVLVGASPTLSVGDSFTIIANDRANAVTGQFAGGSTITAFDNPSYIFTANYAGGDGNDVVLTLTTILPPRTLDVVGGTTVAYTTGSSIDSSLAVSINSGNYVIADDGPIHLTDAAVAAGWTGSDTDTVTGPAAGITALTLNLSDGNDAITGLDGGSAAVSIRAAGTLTTSGTLTTNGDLAFSNAATLTLGGTIDPTGDLTATSVGTLNATSSLTPGGTINLAATDITSGPSVEFTAATVDLIATDAIGTATQSIATTATTISVSAGAGGVFLAEADGATITASATGAGEISITNGSGELDLTATAEAGDLIVAETAGLLNIAGATSTTSGNISLSSGDGIALGANLSSTSGTITIAANTDGSGSDGFDQKAASINTGNSTASAVSIAVNTASGGTGDAIIGQGLVGTDGGGGFTVTNLGGNILWSNDPSYAAFAAAELGTGNGGSNTQILAASAYTFTTGAAGSVGTAARPLQLNNLGTNGSASVIPNLTASAGSGGLYVVDWDGAVGSDAAGTHDLTVGNVSVQGAGNILIDSANAGGHNLWINGIVTGGSGKISLYADDELVMTGNGQVGDANFSGTVDLIANRDAGNGQSLNMQAGSSIITSNNTAAAVSLVAEPGGNGASTGSSDLTPNGGVDLTNVTVGDGGTISVNAAGGTATARQGSIVQRAGTLLDAGVDGAVILLARQFDVSGATGALNTGNIGVGGTATSKTLLPITVHAGTVTATTNGTTEGNTGNIDIIDTIGGNFTVNTTGSTAATTTLATSSGVLTIAGATATGGGAISLASTGASGGVAIDAPLGLGSGNITINAGSNPATLNTTLPLAATQTLSVTAANGLVVSSTGVLTGPGAPANATPVTVAAGGILSPGGSTIAALNVGTTAIPVGGILALDISSTSSFDSLNVNGDLDVTGATLALNVIGTPNVGDSFTIASVTGGPITGQFAGGTTIDAVNDPRYVFSINYTGADNTTIVATVQSILTNSVLDVSTAGVVTFGSIPSLNNDLSVSHSGGVFSITDAAGVINLSPGATAAGWTGDGTNTVSGPDTSATSFVFTLNGGTDTIESLDAGSLPVAINGSDTLVVNGIVATTGALSIGSTTDITGTGTLEADALALTAADGIGTATQALATKANTIIAAAGDGGINLVEADGANITATDSGAGNITIANTAGTLNIAGLTSTTTGNIALSSGDAIALGADVNAGSGTITIAANTDGAGSQGYDQKAASLITTNTTPGAVSITVNAASGGTGDAIIGLGVIGSNSGGGITVTNLGGSILWSNDPSFTAFTGSQTGVANAGSNPQTLKAYEYTFNTGASGSVGTSDRPIQIDNFGMDGAVNTDPNLTISAGSGGAFVVGWDAGNSHDLTVGNVSAQGAGNVLIVAANATTHDLWVNGTVTTGSGSIFLAADDDLFLTPSALIGGPGYSGDVEIVGARDLANLQGTIMQAGSAIVTSSTTATAVVIISQSASGSADALDDLPNGGVYLSNITVGDGGTITVNAAGSPNANHEGSIQQRSGTTLNAGPTGTVALIARENDTTGTANNGNIGVTGDVNTPTPAPIMVSAGTVTATTNGSAIGNTGGIDIIDAIAGTFAATTSGNSAAIVSLTTQAGALTIGDATSNAGGALSLAGAGGVVLNAPLGDASTGAISISGPLSGSGSIASGAASLTIAQDDDSTFDGVISGPEALTKNGSGALTLTAANTYSGGTTVAGGSLVAADASGSGTGVGSVAVNDGTTLAGSGTAAGALVISGTVSPGTAASPTGILNTGSLSFSGTGAQIAAIDLNGNDAGTSYDQINVAGAVDLTNSTLSLTIDSGFSPALHSSFIIVNNDGSDAVTGTFAGLAEGATIAEGNRTFTITYVGGDGNDVALTVAQITGGPPQNSVPGDQTLLEDHTLAFSAASGNPISVSDPDLGNITLEVTLTAAHGALTLSGVNGLTFSAGDGTADRTMTFTGLASDINAALDGLLFVPDANYNGTASVSIATDDLNAAGGGVQSDSDSINVNITPVNDPPSFTLPTPSTVSVLEDAAAQTISGFASNISAGPADESSQTLTFLVSNDSNALFAVQPSLSANGTLTFTPAANSNGSATVTVQLMDDGGTANGGIDTSDTQTFTIDVTSVNDAPVGADNTVTTLEDTTYLFSAGDFGFSDPNDAPPNNLLAVEIDTLPAAGSLTDNGIAVSAGQFIPVSDITGGLLQFAPAANANGTGYASFTFQVQDDGGTANGGVDLSAAANVLAIDVTPVNDAPVGADNRVTTLEDTAYVFSTADFGFSDPNDAPPNNFLAVEIDTLPAAGSLTDNGVAVSAGQFIPAADIANGLLQFAPAANANGAGYASFTFQVQDDGGTANGGVDTSVAPNSIAIDVTSVNDAPTGADNTVSTLEDTTYVFSAGDFGFSDPNDAPPNNILAVEITTLPAAGSLTDNGVAVSAGQFIPIADITGGLLQFAPAADASGAPYASFTFQVQDDGGTANGGVDTSVAPNTIKINVVQLNHAPTGADNTVTTLEDHAYTFAASDFGFSDPNDVPPNTLLAVEIDALPSHGSLTDNGVAVSAGQFIPVADINGGLLQFAPAANANGTGYASFTFQVQDDGGTANGGIDLSITPNALTIDVTAVNDAPNFSLPTPSAVSVLEDAGAQAIGGYASNISAGPPDEASQTLTFLVSNDNNGLFAVQPAIDPLTGDLTFTAAANANGTATVTVQLMDDGGTANGGIDTSAAQTFTIDVASVNDAPTGADRTATILEDHSYTFAASDFGFSDPNDAPPNNFLAVKIDGVPAAGSLTDNGVSVTANQFIPMADIAGGLLQFTPAANANGPSYASFAFQVQDDGGTANGGVDLSAAGNAFTIDVTPVNDAPSFTASNPPTILEDAGPQTVVGWASFNPGPPDEAGQTATYSVSNVSNPALFAAAPSIAANGTLTYTPAANANGSSTFTIAVQDSGGTANGGVDASGTQTFTITVTAVNDVPSFSIPTSPPVSTLEDAGAQTISGFATDISAGPADEAGQSLTFLVANDDNALFAVQPALDPATGTLTFTPAANANGSATVTVQLMDNGGTANGGVDTSDTQTFTIDVAAVNDAPSFNIPASPPVTVLEDSGSQSKSGFATNISAGPADEAGQSLTFLVSNDDNGLFAVQPAIDPITGTLTFTPAANASGTATVTVQLMDDGGTANGGVDTSGTQTFTIDVTAVNDAPTGTDNTVSILEDHTHTFAAADFGFSDPIDMPPNNFLAVKVDSVPAAGSLTDNGAAVTAGQFIPVSDIAGGLLQFTPAANANGADYASFTFQVQDDGGTANGGVDLSIVPNTLTIDVTAVNDAPSFSIPASPPISALEDAGAQTAAGFATNISAGPADEAGQSLTFLVSNDDNALFAVQPAIDPATGALTFTPAANANGSATVTVRLMDDGGTANGGVDTSDTQTFTIDVAAVNDAPSFSIPTSPPVSVLEDAGAQTISGFATDISAGPADEAGQSLTFLVSNDDNALFAVQPALDPATGTLTFTPAANANGSATVTVQLMDNGGTANGGVDTSGTQTFTIDVAAVNDAPSFSLGSAPAVLEDAGAQTVAGFASGMSAGPPDEAGQTLTFLVSSGNTGLFAVQPAIDPITGTLTYTPAANGNGSATITVRLMDDGGTANGGLDTSNPQTFTIDVTSVNDAPMGADHAATVLEDHSYAFATADFGFSDPNDSPANAFLAVKIASLPSAGMLTDNGTAVAAGQFIPIMDVAGGNLLYTPAANGNGANFDSFTFQIQDNGGTANGGVDLSATANTMTFNVTAVNDSPSFTLPAAPVSVLEDAGAQSRTGFATNISAGPPDEASQTLSFLVSNDNNALFAVQPSIDPITGNLTFTAAANANGSATVTVQLMDDGGTASGGVDTSDPQTFTIDIAAVNDAPSFALPAAPVSVLEDAGAQTTTGFATSISAGPPDEASQTLNFIVTNDNAALFAMQPSLSANGALTFTPAANANGTATVTVKLMDSGGTANGGIDASVTQTFTIDVAAVNDAPSFSLSTTAVSTLVDSGPQTVSGFATNIKAGPANEASQTVNFQIATDNAALFSVPPRIDPATGDLTFTPAPNASGTATVTVKLMDNGGTANGGVDTSSAQTFTIAVAGSPQTPIVVSGSSDGAAQIYNANASGQVGATPIAVISPFGNTGTSVRTTTADVNGDGIADTILVTGPGTPIRVAVVSGADNSTVLVAPFDPFGGNFMGGGFVAAGDFDRDGRAEFVVTPDQGGGPRISIFSLTSGGLVQRANYFTIDPDFRGGARAAVGDINGDGVPDLAVAAGFGGGPRIVLINGQDALTTDGFNPADRLVGDFFAFDQSLRNGAYIAIGDVNGDGFGDLIFGAGPGGGPQVLVVSGKSLLSDGVLDAIAAPLANFFVNNTDSDRSGVRVAAVHADSDGLTDVMVGTGEEQPSRARLYLGKNLGGSGEPADFQDIDAFGGDVLTDGVFVG